MGKGETTGVLRGTLGCPKGTKAGRVRSPCGLLEAGFLPRRTGPYPAGPSGVLSLPDLALPAPRAAGTEDSRVLCSRLPPRPFPLEELSHYNHSGQLQVFFTQLEPNVHGVRQSSHVSVETNSNKRISVAYWALTTQRFYYRVNPSNVLTNQGRFSQS